MFKNKHDGTGPRRNMNASRYAALIHTLQTETLTLKQIAEKIELSYEVVWKYTDALLNHRPRLIRVGEWVNVRTEERPLWVEAWTWGSERHAPRPPKAQRSEYCKRYRARKKLRPLDAALHFKLPKGEADGSEANRD